LAKKKPNKDLSALGPTLETDRLILRPPMAEDLAPWAAMLADSQAARFIGGPQALHGAWRNLAMMTGPGASSA
jgi:RimJ/RimL family protein N-acetyltransferase